MNETPHIIEQPHSEIHIPHTITITDPVSSFAFLISSLLNGTYALGWLVVLQYVSLLLMVYSDPSHQHAQIHDLLSLH